MSAVYTSHRGDNADLFRQASTLYIKDGAIVADVTAGRMAFWAKTDVSRFHLIASDRKSWPIAQSIQLSMFSDDRRTQRMLANFRKLPYRDHSIDVLVLDPPYAHNASKMMITANRYRNGDEFGTHETEEDTSKYYHRDILEKFYRAGMVEARRVLKPNGGQLFLKIKDEVESGVQRWGHLEVYQMALTLGFFARDLFILLATSHTSEKRWKKQIHARKDHSYLWVFEVPTDRYLKDLMRAGIFQNGTENGIGGGPCATGRD